jgi:hypothetical protein
MLLKRKQIGEQVSKQKKEIMEKFDKTMKGNKEMNVSLLFNQRPILLENCFLEKKGKPLSKR